MAMLTVGFVAAFDSPVIVVGSVVAVICLLIVTYKIERGILLLLALTPFESFLSVNFNATKVVKVALTLVIIGILFLDRVGAEKRKPKHDPYLRIFGFMVCTAFLATVQSEAPLLSAMGFVAIVIYFLLYSELVQWSGWEKYGERVLRLLLLISIPCAILALLQLFFGYASPLGSPEQRDMESQGIFFTFIPHVQRASSTFGSVNAAAAFFGLTSLIAYCHIVIFREHRFWTFSALALSVLAVFATFSRGAILGLIVGLVYATYALTRSRWPFAVVPIVLLVAMLIYVPVDALTGYFRLGSDIAETSLSRVSAWNAAMVIFEKHPIAGIGFYEFQQASEKLEAETDTPTHPHNGFLKALVEQGIFGALAYLAFVIAMLRIVWRTMRRALIFNASQRWILASIGCATLCLLSQELFDAGLTIGSSSIAVLFVSLLALQVNLLNRIPGAAGSFLPSSPFMGSNDVGGASRD